MSGNNPWLTDAYQTLSIKDIGKAQLEVKLMPEAGGEYTFMSEAFTVHKSFRELNGVSWKKVDSTISEEQLRLSAISNTRFPEYRYKYEALLMDSAGNVLAVDKGTWRNHGQNIQVESTDSTCRVFYDQEYFSQCTIKVRNKGIWSTPDFADGSAFVKPTVDSVTVIYEGICVASKQITKPKTAKPDLAQRSIRTDSRLALIPVKAFGVDRVSVTAGASYAERQYPGSALSTPFYTGGLNAQLNLFGLPFNASAYGLWLRNSEWPSWVNSPQNFFRLEFDKDRFDQQYALDLSDGQVRDAIEKKRNLAIRDQIAQRQMLLKLDSNALPDSTLQSPLSLPGIPNELPDSLQSPDSIPTSNLANNKKRLVGFPWLRMFNRKDSLNDASKSADKHQKQRESFEEQEEESRQKIAEYDRLLHQIDSASAQGSNLSMTEVSPALIKEFAQAGLINRQLARIQSLEIGSVYPKRYVDEIVPSLNEYRGASIELTIMKNLDLYTLFGSSRFSISNGSAGSALMEGGLIKRLKSAELSLIVSRETSASPFQRPQDDEAINGQLNSYDKTYLLFGYDQRIGKIFSAGISGEQRASTLTKLDSLSAVGRYYAYTEAAYRILNVRLYGEYVDQSFFRNIYLGPIPGSLKGGVETGIQLFKGRVSGLFGYETLLQIQNMDSENGSETRNSGFKYALSTAFSKVPNVSIAYHPFYTSSRAQFNGNRTIVSFSSQSSLSQATVSYAYTGGKYKLSTAVQAQRITNAITYDIESSEQQVNSQVDALFGTLSAFNERHTYLLSVSHQQLDTSQNQNASVQYEWAIKPFKFGTRIGAGKNGNELAYQFAAIVKMEVGDFKLHLEPGVTQFEGEKRFYPTLQIQLSKDLWKKN